MRERVKNSPTVFLGPLEISGFYGNLEAGFSEIGVAARLVVLHPHPHNYPQSQRNPFVARVAVRAVLRHREAGLLGRVFFGAVFVVAEFCLLIWTLPRFNSYVFSWGESLLPGNIDIPFLRLLGKNVLVVLGHGSESRPPYMSTPPGGTPPLSPTGLRRLKVDTSRVARKVRRIERWATTTIGLPTTAQFFRRAFVDFYALGLPTVQPEDAKGPSTTTEHVVVLHVPSKPEVKGSQLIRECMEELTAKYPRVRYLELAGRPHDEILDAIRRSSLVIDQLWSDIPMAVVGTEAAIFGKPTVIAGYAWDEWRKRLADEDWPPTIVTSPDRLLRTVEDCILDMDGTELIGRRARAFVADRWSRSAVAKNYLSVLTGEAPEHWKVNPSEISYGYGCGVSRENVDYMVNALVSTFGTGSLEWPRAGQVYGFG